MRRRSQDVARASGVFVALLVAGLGLAGAAEGALVQWWRFDDGAGTTAANQIAGGNTGALRPVGSEPLWVLTGLAPALTGRASFPSTAALDFSPAGTLQDYVDGGVLGLASTGPSGEATVSLWVKPETLVDDLRLLGQLAGSASNGGAVRTRASGAIEVWTGGVWVPLAPSGSLANGIWTHVALAWSLGTVTAYVNGASAGSAVSDFDFAADAFGIGARFLLAHGGSFDGVIDDVAVWDTRLASGEIGALASGVTPVEATVPEPATAGLVGLGVLAAGWLRRSRGWIGPRRSGG